ncbi:MAG: GNAT family N-acetyltransferase, partial [Lachnospiraceae bacterium]|nr:GNAT family N-acetyltransferase [Lachnospiraceae bacterium]
MSEAMINLINFEHLEEYAEIYAAAFAGEPWHDPWKVEDALIHVRELLGSAQSYGLEYIVDGEIAGFILGSTMLFHYGRIFEINDLAVAPKYQGQGIGAKLLERCLSDMKEKGIAAVNLITSNDKKL